MTPARSGHVHQCARSLAWSLAVAARAGHLVTVSELVERLRDVFACFDSSTTPGPRVCEVFADEIRTRYPRCVCGKHIGQFLTDDAWGLDDFDDAARGLRCRHRSNAPVDRPRRPVARVDRRAVDALRPILPLPPRPACRATGLRATIVGALRRAGSRFRGRRSSRGAMRW